MHMPRARGWAETFTGPRQLGLFRHPLVLIALLSILGAVWPWLLVGGEAQVKPDSPVYLSTAENIAEGRGVASAVSEFWSRTPPAEALRSDGAVVLADFPPAYPFVLAPFVALGASAVDAAAIVGLLALAVTLFASGYCAWKVTGSIVAGASAPVLLTLGPGAKGVFQPESVPGLAMTASADALYGAVLLSTVALVITWQQNQDDRLLLTAALVSSMGPMIRFVGLALPVMLAVVVLLVDGQRRGRRWDRAAGTAAVGLVPTLCWLGYQMLTRSVGGPKQIVSHPRPLAEPVLRTVGAWSTGLDLSPSAAASVLVVLGTVVAIALVGSKRLYDAAWPIGLFLAVHLGIVIVTVLFLDAIVVVSDRILLPVRLLLTVLVVIGATGAVAKIQAGRPRRTGAAVAISAVVVLATVGGPSTYRSLRDPAVVQPAPGVLTTLAGEYPARPVISNSPDAVWLRLRRPVTDVPRRTVATTGASNDEFDAQVTAYLREIDARGGAVLVEFPQLFAPEDFLSAADIAERRRVRPLGTAGRATVFAIDPA